VKIQPKSLSKSFDIQNFYCTRGQGRRQPKMIVGNKTKKSQPAVNLRSLWHTKYAYFFYVESLMRFQL